MPLTGAVYLFDTASGLQTNKLFANDGTPQQEFGFSVAIDGSLAVIGAKSDGTVGAAYLFDVVSGSQLFKLHPSDGQQGDSFGISVAISGTKVLVGTLNAEAAYLFDATTCTQLAKFQGTSQSQEHFGFAIGIDGNTAIVGAPSAFDVSTQQNAAGSAYIFDVQSFSLLGQLSPPVPEENTYFWASVDVYGASAVVGRPSSGNGRAHLFDVPTLTHTFQLQSLTPSFEGNFGASVAITQGRALVGNSSANWKDTFYDLPTEIVTPGTRYFQCWFRDPHGIGTPLFSLSNALSVTFLP